MGLVSCTGRILIALLSLVSVAHGAISLVASNTTGNNTSGTSWTPVYPASISAGHWAILLLAMDNAGSAGSAIAAPATVSDSKGNSYTRDQDGIFDNGAASAGVEVAIYSGKIATAVNGTDTLTFTWVSGVSVTAKTLVIKDYTVGAGTTLSEVTSGNGTGATTGAPTVTTGTITVGDLAVGVCGAESADTFTADSDTTNGSWDTTTVHVGVGSGTTGSSVDGQGKVQTTTNSTQTFNPTLTSVDTMIAWAQYREVTIPLSNGFLFFFP